MKEPLPTGTQRAKADREHPSGVWVAPELFRSGVNGVLYREMAKLLRTEIQSGRLAAGTRLPSISCSKPMRISLKAHSAAQPLIPANLCTTPKALW